MKSIVHPFPTITISKRGFIAIMLVSVSAFGTDFNTLPAEGVDCDEATLKGSITSITLSGGSNGGWATFFISESSTGPWDWSNPNYIAEGVQWYTEVPSDSKSIQLSIGGLKGGTTYYYKLYSTDYAGERWANTRSFTTSDSPIAETFDAQGIGPTTATLYGQVTPVAGQPCGAFFQYWEAANPGLKASTGVVSIGSDATPQDVSAPIAGLPSNTMIEFRVVGVRTGCGNSYGEVMSFVTAEDPTEVDTDGDGMTDADEILAGTDPGDPNSLFVMGIGVHQASGLPALSWQSASDKVYRVFRATTLTSGLNDFVEVFTGVVATPPQNELFDVGATGTGPYYYLLQVE